MGPVRDGGLRPGCDRAPARLDLPAPVSQGVLVLALLVGTRPRTQGPGLAWDGDPDRGRRDGGDERAPPLAALSTSRSSRGRAVAVMTWRISGLRPPGPVTATSMDGTAGAVSVTGGGAARLGAEASRIALQPAVAATVAAAPAAR